MRNRVVITGLGVVSSIGIGKDDFWKNLIVGQSGISEIETFDTTSYDVHNGGEIKNFDFAKYIKAKNLPNMARASQFTVAATKLAIEDAGVKKDTLINAGVIIGTTMADIQSLEIIDRLWAAEKESEIWAANVIKYPGNELSNNVGYCLGVQGINSVIPTACSAGNYSIGYAFDLIRQGKYSTVFAGGADPISRITFTGFSRLFAMAPDVCRPFDKNRKGMMVGEGAGILVIEEYEQAKKRNAEIYAEILGYGLSCDAHHMTSPNVEGITKVMEKAVRNAQIKKINVDYICAHGTGTPANDKAETDAIKIVFGEHAKNIAISSIKSMLGHTMGAASAIEAIVCSLSLKNEIIAPTINYDTVDPECDLDYVPTEARKKKMNIVLNNSLAFGGNNACLVLGKYGD